MRTLLYRGSQVESVHEAIGVAVTPRGQILLSHGVDSATMVCLRSVAKPFQTLALFEAGVVDRYQLTDEEISVVTASHAGEAYHLELVHGLLSRGSLTEDHLLCGTHAPFSPTERRRRVREGEAFSVLGNNCSGKHAGMLLHALHIGSTLEDYLEPQHPVQSAIRNVLENFLGESLGETQVAVDGCGAAGEASFERRTVRNLLFSFFFQLF